MERDRDVERIFWFVGLLGLSCFAAVCSVLFAWLIAQGLVKLWGPL